MPALAIISVSWNTRDLLHRSIESVHASLSGSGIDYTIVVVDNASTDGTPAMLRAEHPEVVLLQAGRNLGFAGGNNLALRRVLGAGHPRLGTSALTPNTGYPTPDYVFLLNPDTEVVGEAIPGRRRAARATVGLRRSYEDRGLRTELGHSVLCPLSSVLLC